MTEIDETKMYWGCVGGSMSKALRHMEETHVMVSYASTAKLWDWIEEPFLDSGATASCLSKVATHRRRSTWNMWQKKNPTDMRYKTTHANPKL